MKKVRRSGAAKDPPEGVPVSFVTPEDSHREWLISRFASFAEERGDLGTLLAWSTDRLMRGRPGGLPGPGHGGGDRRLSAGRRWDDFSRDGGRRS